MKLANVNTTSTDMLVVRIRYIIIIGLTATDQVQVSRFYSLLLLLVVVVVVVVV